MTLLVEERRAIKLVKEILRFTSEEAPEPYFIPGPLGNQQEHQELLIFSSESVIVLFYLYFFFSLKAVQ